MPKYASIDVGSNTLLLLIVDDEVTDGRAGDKRGALTSVVDECDFARLGKGLAHSASLQPESMERALQILRKYRALMDQHEICAVACVGTQALREANNSAEFIRQAEQLVGCPIEVITGEREAALVARAVICDFPGPCQGDVMCIDVGGASTEFIHIRAGQQVSAQSLPIGAVRMTEAYLRSDPATPAQIVDLHGAIDKAIAQISLPAGAQLIGSAGTATTIASIKLKLARYQPERVHGLCLTATDVADISSALLAKTLAQKLKLPGLDAKRVDIIAGGAAIYERVVHATGATGLLISDRGVRWGLAYELSAPTT